VFFAHTGVGKYLKSSFKIVIVPVEVYIHQLEFMDNKHPFGK
jgi:hypothetical protein